MIMGIEQVARVCHEANRAYCVTQGDFTQPSFDNAPDWQRASAVEGVKNVLKNPDCRPQDSHESWSKQKLADGWKYGPKKDAAKKEHPCLVPYENLPVAQQRKDALFIAIAKALLNV